MNRCAEDYILIAIVCLVSFVAGLVVVILGILL